jgi:hypothetical protein
LILVPLHAKALTPDEIKAAISQKIRDMHPEPDPTFWTNLGPESVPIMENLFKVSTSPIEQSWLIEGLSHFSDPSIAGVLESGIQNADNAVSKKKMLGALIESQGDASLDFVEPYLKDKDPHIRLTVAKGLQRFMPDNPLARERLLAFNAAEKEAWVKSDLLTSASESKPIEKRGGSIYDSQTPLKVLSEKEWVGDWTGVWLSDKKSSAAKVNLSRLEKEKSWKAVIKLPKQSAYELKHDGMEVLYYTSSHLHWIEIRNKKDDSVFIGQRKP